MFVFFIFDIVLFGLFVVYSDGQLKLFVCFIKKFVVWKFCNGVGCFVCKELGCECLIYMMLLFFILYEGDFGEGGIIFIIIMCSYGIDSDLNFWVIECLKIGQVCVVQDVGENVELLYFVENCEVVEFWLVRNGYSCVCFEEIIVDEVGVDVVEG